MYIWARNPGGLNSMDFASRLIEEANVVVTPGSGFGANGEGYFRISLTVPDARLNEAMDRLEAWHRGSSQPVGRTATA